MNCHPDYSHFHQTLGRARRQYGSPQYTVPLVLALEYAESRRQELERTADLELLADWLTACGIATVAMESTGVYWITLFELLERRGFEVFWSIRARPSRSPAGPRPMCSIACGPSVCIATAC